MMGELKEEIVKSNARTEELQAQVNLMSQELTLRTSSNIPSDSYAAIARTPPDSQANVSPIPVASTTPSSMVYKIYCTIDVSRVQEEEKEKINTAGVKRRIENKIRESENRKEWKCVAVSRDPRNDNRIRIICRNEEELDEVKRAAGAIAKEGARIMRDQLYPVKVDSVYKPAVMGTEGTLREGIERALSEENEVKISKISWLSKKDKDKKFGSMVVYLSRSEDARKLLSKGWIECEGESSMVRVFEPKITPTQCYKCQQLGHKAFSCDKEEVCARSQKPEL
jgi:hypothetical protein